MINIQQAAKQMIVLPQDFYIREPNKALVSFGKNGDNKNKRVSTVKKSQYSFGDTKRPRSCYQRLP
jgi:hypothetical protein